MTGSLCCISEIDTTLQINYTLKNKGKKEKREKKQMSERSSQVECEMCKMVEYK